MTGIPFPRIIPIANADSIIAESQRAAGQFMYETEYMTFDENNLFQLLMYRVPRIITISDFDSETKYDSNAFGNVDGGKLWTLMNVPSVDFPEDVFRLLLKTHFDKGHQSKVQNQIIQLCSLNLILLFVALLTTSGGPNMVDNCMSSCDIAWLYKDAHMFGINAYKGLIGPNNVICSDVGPILESQDPEFIAFMDNCPCK